MPPALGVCVSFAIITYSSVPDAQHRTIPVGGVKGRVGVWHFGCTECWATFDKDKRQTIVSELEKKAVQQSQKPKRVEGIYKFGRLFGIVRMSDCVQGIEPCGCKGKGHQFQRLGW